MRFLSQYLSVALLAALVSAGLLSVNACAAPERGNANERPAAVNQTNMNKDDEQRADARNAQTPAAAATPATVDHATASNPASDIAADVDFTTNVRADGRDQLLVSYTVKNRGRQSLLLMNRPPARGGASPSSSSPPNPNFVYVETRPDGVVEISKRVQEPPRETTVFIPDVLGATLLAPGQSFSEEVRVDLAARRRRSAQAVRDVPNIPDPVKRVRFCLGVAPSEGITARSFGQGKNKVIYPDAGAVLQKQRVLCGDVMELQQ
ncbi:MAG TPA: hypothetical protein VGW12_15565 [Pyrinomonadaceae bacterium]|nr:hypothetical protein [Pyrinomonadaceae bacterium]